MIDFNSLPSEADNPLNQIVQSPIKTIEYTIEEVAARIDSVDELSDSDIKNIIERQHEIFLNYKLFISIAEKRRSLQKLFSNLRFIRIFNSVIGKLKLTDEEIICANKLCYDYYTAKFSNTETGEYVNAVINEYIALSSIINFDLGIKLSAMIDVNYAKILAMVYNSAFLIEKRVHRVHYFLMSYFYTELSVQDIVNILCILFDKNFTKVFISLMLELKLPNYSNTQVKRFDDISSAIISMVDSMPSKDIQMMMLDYANYIRVNNINRVRFSMKTIANKERILSCINQVEFSSGLMVP